MSRLKTDAIRNVNASVDGITLDTSGNVAIPNELQLADKIVHTGDTNTFIRFPAADTVSVETAGSERLRITSDGKVAIGFNAPAVAGLSIANGSTSLGFEFDTGSGFSGGPTIRGYYRPGSAYKSLGITGSDIKFGINDVEKLRIDVNGYLGLGLNDPHLYYAKELVVKAASEGGITIRNTGANDWNYIMFATGTSGSSRYSGWIAYDHGDNKLKIAVNEDVSGKGFEFLANGNLEIKDGNLVVANGHGIDFSADGNASGADDELLNDYEEGDWTPTPIITHQGGSGSLSSIQDQYGRYVKIGREVRVWFYFKFTAANITNCNVGVSGLPFTVSNDAQWNNSFHGGIARRGITGGETYICEGMYKNNTQITVLRKYDNYGFTNTTQSVGGTACYLVD